MNKEIREMVIEETFKKISGKVYWTWRFAGEKKWRKELTPYKEIPFGQERLQWKNTFRVVKHIIKETKKSK